MRVSGRLARSWPTRPAEWNVEPLVSSSRSSSTTSASPRRARWWAIAVPPTPPPTITMRALAGSSRGRKPLLEVGPADRGEQALEVPGRVTGEVEVEFRHSPLDDAPAGLARVGQDPHQFQRRAPSVGRSLLVVGGEHALVGGLVEAVVDRQVAEVEVRVAHARVLPVDDQDPPVVLRPDDVPRKQVVVARQTDAERDRRDDPG